MKKAPVNTLVISNQLLQGREPGGGDRNPVQDADLPSIEAPCGGEVEKAPTCAHPLPPAHRRTCAHGPTGLAIGPCLTYALALGCELTASGPGRPRPWGSEVRGSRLRLLGQRELNSRALRTRPAQSGSGQVPTPHRHCHRHRHRHRHPDPLVPAPETGCGRCGPAPAPPPAVAWKHPGTSPAPWTHGHARGNAPPPARPTPGPKVRAARRHLRSGNFVGAPRPVPAAARVPTRARSRGPAGGAEWGDARSSEPDAGGRRSPWPAGRTPRLQRLGRTPTRPQAAPGRAGRGADPALDRPPAPRRPEAADRPRPSPRPKVPPPPRAHWPALQSRPVPGRLLPRWPPPAPV